MRRALLGAFSGRGPFQTLELIPSTSTSSFEHMCHIGSRASSSEKDKSSPPPSKGGKGAKPTAPERGPAAAGKAVSTMDSTAPLDQISFQRSVIREHLYNTVLPDIILKQNINHVQELPVLKEVILHQHNEHLTSSPQAFLPAMAGMQLASGRRPEVVQDVRKSGTAREKRAVHVPMALMAKLRHRDMYGFLDRVCMQAALNQVREWPGVRWDWNGHIRFQFPNLFAFDEVAAHVEDFKSVNHVDVHLHVDARGGSHVVGKLLATGIGLPVDRDYPGPRPMTTRPWLARAPRAGEPGPRRRRVIEQKKKDLEESYKRSRGGNDAAAAAAPAAGAPAAAKK